MDILFGLSSNLHQWTRETIGIWKKSFIRNTQSLEASIEKIFSNEKWIKIENKNLYYSIDYSFLMEFKDEEDENVFGGYVFDKSHFNLNVDKYEGRIPSYEEAMEICDNIDVFSSYIVIAGNFGLFGILDTQNYYMYPITYSRATVIPVYTMSLLNLLIEYKLTFDWMPEEYTDFLTLISELYEKKIITSIEETADLLEFADDATILKYLSEKDSKIIKTEEKKVQPEKSLGSGKMNEIVERLINCDALRCGLTPYDEQYLYDSNRGHWELWKDEYNKNENSVTECVKLEGYEKSLYARNPVADINKNSVVAIDFGTKSTVAVILDETSRIEPIRIGYGDLTRNISSDQFENPTVIELIDIEEFFNMYDEKDGRPETSNNHMEVSHNANEKFKESSNKDFKSFVMGLKQYASQSKNMNCCDKKGCNISVKPYGQLGDSSELSDIDFIEVYAYYIGLYINNMYRGIYLNYILSMPVTFESDIRERLKNSFEKGLKKSLPETLLNNEEVMKTFKITAETNESAAYAVTALTQFGFEPEDDEKVFYGIFDFGGGTADFDFGFWEESDSRRYDYAITYYDDEGDKTLGGENLLEMIAYSVWCDNIEEMKKNNIPINLPVDCEKMAGCELLICSDTRNGMKKPSDESSFNIRKLSEKLRWIWEGNTEEFENELEEIEKNDGVYKLKPDLYNCDAKQITTLEIIVDTNKLKKMLKERIEKGVRNFFECLRKNASRFIKEENIDKFVVNIFLAGNSSRSVIVEELFNKYIGMEIEELKKITNVEDIDPNEHFKIFYPLGTEKANEQILAVNPDYNVESIENPNCKTGVAYGLVLTRTGGKIKVFDKRLAKEPFDYYIGYNKKNRFIHTSDKKISKEKWIEFISADENTFELYYTSYPEAVTNKLPVTDVKKLICTIEKTDDDAYVYYRAVANNSIEYVVAKNCTDGIIEESDYLTAPVRIELE